MDVAVVVVLVVLVVLAAAAAADDDDGVDDDDDDIMNHFHLFSMLLEVTLLVEEHETPEAEEVISIQPTCADGPLAEAAGMFHDEPRCATRCSSRQTGLQLVVPCFFVLVILTYIN